MKTPNGSEPNDLPEKRFSLREELLGLLALLLTLCLFCGAAGAVLTPRRQDCGAVWGMYLKEPEQSLDTLFFGSSLAYCDIVPAVLYEEAAVTSFVMAGPDQTMSMTLRYVRESLRTQSPNVIFIEASALLAARENRSVKVNIAYMPWGLERLAATVSEPLSGEDRLGLLFPLAAYHSRWDKLTADDVSAALLGEGTDPLAGYTCLFGTAPVKETARPPISEAAYLKNLNDARALVNFCGEKGVRPVFFLSPTLEPLDGAAAACLQNDLSALGAELIDFSADAEKIGLDGSTDYFDPQHLNSRGAEKLSRYLAKRLPEFGVAPAGTADEPLWRQRVEYFQAKQREGDGA